MEITTSYLNWVRSDIFYNTKAGHIIKSFHQIETIICMSRSLMRQGKHMISIIKSVYLIWMRRNKSSCL